MPTATPGSAKPILVLGLGNLLLMDDGFGPALVERLRCRVKDATAIELLDGGTMGLGLLGLLEGRRAVLLLDAFRSGAEPGTLAVYEDFGWQGAGHEAGRSAHEGNAASLLAVAALLGEVPKRLCLIGIEPGQIATGVGFSAAVEARLEEAEEAALRLLDGLLEQPACA